MLRYAGVPGGDVVERSDVVVIGGGQAGLATSYHLARRSIDHLVLERSRVAETWRNRWTSFTLVIPNWACQLPGFEYEGEHPDGFMPRDEIVAFLERFAASFDPPIHRGAEASSIQRENNGDYRVETTSGDFRAPNVVVATGAFPRPHMPSITTELPENLLQLHTDSYRDPGALPPGNVLICGAGQSGVQIAEELLEAGRGVFIAAGRCAWGPRRYRGRDTSRWLHAVGFLDKTVDSLESPADRLGCNLQATGRNGGHDLNLRLLAEKGARLLGRLEAVSDHTLAFGADLAETLAQADEQALKIVGMIDRYIEDTGTDAPPPEETPGLAAANAAKPLEPVGELDLRAAEVSTVIWATGYRLDFGWLHLSPLIDQQRFPLHRRGVSEHPGLYFVGLPWLHKAKSSLILGADEDAEYVASHLADRVGSR
jgi:putative flavoprotein involved in K+ transport